MVLKLYPLRLEERQIIEIERRANGQPIAPLFRKIIDDWLSTDPGQQKEQIICEIEQHEGIINLLRSQLNRLNESESKKESDKMFESQRIEYIKLHPEVIQMYKDGTISTKGYAILKVELGLSSKDKINEWLCDNIKNY